MKNVARSIIAGVVGGVLTLAFLATGIFGGQSVSADDPTTEIQTAQQHLEITINDNVGTITATDTQHLEITITNNVGSIVATATHHLVITVAVDPLDVMTATHLFQITVNDPNVITLTLDKTSLSLAGSPNMLLSDYLTANVLTANPTGYVLQIESAEPRLKCATGDYYIEPLTSAGSMSDNHWGWAYDGGISLTTAPENLTWDGVAISPTEIKNSTTATDLTTGENIRLWLGTKVNFSLPACAYSGSAKISAVKDI
jgi:hypothetical protein